METFWFYFKLGFDHVLDPGGLDHFYFLIALTLPFMFREWKKLLIWVSIFTLGHTLSLFASNFKWIFLTEILKTFFRKKNPFIGFIQTMRNYCAINILRRK